MTNKITGRILSISNTVQIQSKNSGATFTKREFLLDATTYDPYTKERSEYENIIPLESQAINAPNWTVLKPVMLLPCHLFYRGVPGLLRTGSLNVWCPSGVIK